MTQEELVKRVQIKDIMAFERLYDMYWENICGVINTIVPDKSLSEEISQDVFAQVWNDSHKYNPSKGRFFSWLLKIARKAAIDKVNSKFSENDKKNLSADYVLGMLKDGQINHQPKDLNGFKKLSKNVARKNMEIVDLLYFKGYTEQQTSELLGINQRRIKKINRSSISQIRENMTFEWM